MVTPPTQKAYDQIGMYLEWQRKDEGLFDAYLGKAFQEIEVEFGKPKSCSDVNQSTNPSFKGQPYMVCEYKALPIGESKGYFFFFRDGMLYEVTSLGKKESKLKETASYLYF